MLLGKIEKNNLFKVLTGSGLNLVEFNIDARENDADIYHEPTQSLFTIEQINPEVFTANYRVGDGPNRKVNSSTFEEAISHVNFWALELRNYIEAPDLWEELFKDAEFVRGLGERGENSRFNNEERSNIASELRRVAQEARHTYSLGGTEFQALSAKVDYLIEASDRSGRNDWLFMGMGVLMSFLFSVGLPSHQAQSFFSLFMTAIAHFSGHELPMFPL